MKGGIVQAIHAVAALDDASGVEMLFTADEEVGSDVVARAARGSAPSPAATCSCSSRAPTAARSRPAARAPARSRSWSGGRAAHAGLEPEKGINALVEAAHQVLAIAALRRRRAPAPRSRRRSPTPAPPTTSCPPRLASGSTCASPTPRRSTRVEALMAALQPVLDGRRDRGAAASISRPPMPESASATLFPIARRGAARTWSGVAVGGGSDGNFTAALGVPTLDGLGAVGGGAHADHEYVLDRHDARPGQPSSTASSPASSR